MAVRAFISYAHEDAEFRSRLEVHLSQLRRQGRLDVWQDRRIVAGEDWDHEIKAELEDADLILLLVSSDFLNSDYCWAVEVSRALERHEAGSAVVVPIILRVCDWHDTPFAKLQALPDGAKPISKWGDPDEAYHSVVEGLKRVLDRLKPTDAGQAAPQPEPSGARAGTADPAPRSGNLWVKKAFTDKDRDDFKEEAFEFIARFFESSLDELAARNAGLEGRFRRLDQVRFTATVYRDGGKVAGCTVFSGSSMFGGHGIGYHGRDDGATDSMNEHLVVANDEHGLFLEGLFGSIGANRDQRLSLQGAAEHLWASFIAPLQR